MDLITLGALVIPRFEPAYTEVTSLDEQYAKDVCKRQFMNGADWVA